MLGNSLALYSCYLHLIRKPGANLQIHKRKNEWVRKKKDGITKMNHPEPFYASVQQQPGKDIISYQ